jgi:hypothetical protein
MTETEPAPGRLAYADSQAAAAQAVEDYFERGWTDGLPVVPPSEELVARMLAGTPRGPQEVLGPVPPRMGLATVEAVAVNAVMAGCKPEYLPVVLAALEAMLEERFNLNGVQATTFAGGPLTIVHGPIARRIGVNGGFNVFGSGVRANATIGRALRLILFNLGGAYPGVGDMTPLGMPSKYTFCIAENEAEGPWAPFHTDHGFAAKEDAVTVFSCEGPTSVIGGLYGIGEHLASVGSNNMLLGGEVMVVFSPPAAQDLARDGWSKDDVRRYLFEHGRAPLWKLFKAFGREMVAERTGRGAEGERWPAWLDLDDPQTMVPVVRRVEDIHLVVAGGTTAVRFTAVLGGWGYMGGFAITRGIRS